ncbi:hypothetical protein CEP52_004872 [Fusarium oligoseptatum]|uniref:Major facilitator superfamily (MFS) profile domain-containing protein n=1 Tax=Fusarium oligoseptatum TaxID=2604345 RepID=A0A428U1M0_9HYPO|nr:hypothetical protein CEP52_004872 [Fusarium oligoseptatum]
MARGVFAGKAAFAQATPRLMMFCTIYALGSIFFGYDGASFGGVQAMDPFLRTFGKWNKEKETYYLPSDLQSLMNSLPLIGKFLGTVIVGPIIERFGHRYTMAFTCCIQVIGPIIQVTSKNPAQFIVGRFMVYTAVVPTYQSEIAPGALRGFFVGIVNESMSRKTDNSGWQIATALQALPAVIIICLLFFTPNSPRWLIFNDRYEEALKVLRSVRRKQDVDNGLPELELASMREEGQAGRREKGPWKDLINRENRRRTGIACAIMTFQQLTGVTFSSSYGPTFYRSVGLSDMAFIYAVVNNATSVVTAMMAMVFLDMFGRRTLVIHGGWSQGAFLIAIAALGRIKNPNVHESNGIVAGMQLYTCILHMTLGPGAYITAAEVGTQALREKTMAVSTALNVVVGFVVVFCTPYLLREIGSGLAYIWGGFAGRNLEEIDQLFEANIPAWKFNKYQTGGLTHELAVLENGEVPGKKLDEEADIDVDRVENARR